MMKKLLIAISVVWFMSGCAVMHFKQDNQPSPKENLYEKMHHNVAYDLYELSPAVKPSSSCGNKDWNSVTTKTGFLTGIIGSIDEVILFSVDVWTPQDVIIACSSEEAK